MKKYRFTSKFIVDTFSGKNTIVRKSDNHRWTINLSTWVLLDESGRFECLGDESLAQFFDDDNNFRYDLYELTYIDHFKEFCKSELRQHGKEWLDNMPDGEQKEELLKRLIGV